MALQVVQDTLTLSEEQRVQLEVLKKLLKLPSDGEAVTKIFQSLILQIIKPDLEEVNTVLREEKTLRTIYR